MFGATNRAHLKPKSSKAERHDIKLTKDGKIFEISKTYVDRTHRE
jgi:gamma-glutamyl-gamma-aminobutyrate hydrolase PuuD